MLIMDDNVPGPEGKETSENQNKKNAKRHKSVACSSPMGPCQGMSDRVRAAEALTKENIV